MIIKFNTPKFRLWLSSQWFEFRIWFFQKTGIKGISRVRSFLHDWRYQRMLRLLGLADGHKSVFIEKKEDGRTHMFFDDAFCPAMGFENESGEILVIFFCMGYDEMHIKIQEEFPDSWGKLVPLNKPRTFLVSKEV